MRRPAPTKVIANLRLGQGSGQVLTITLTKAHGAGREGRVEIGGGGAKNA
jgi:hypothetical protein